MGIKDTGKFGYELCRFYGVRYLLTLADLHIARLRPKFY